MGTPLGPKYIPYTYMDPLGYMTIAEAYERGSPWLAVPFSMGFGFWESPVR